jgi:hypothetical protein
VDTTIADVSEVIIMGMIFNFEEDISPLELYQNSSNYALAS